MTILRSAQYSNINNIIIITSDNSDYNQSARDRDLPYAGQNTLVTSDVSNTTDLIIMLSMDKN